MTKNSFLAEVTFNPLIHNGPKWSNNLKFAATAARFLKCACNHFGRLCVKGLKKKKMLHDIVATGHMILFL